MPLLVLLLSLLLPGLHALDSDPASQEAVFQQLAATSYQAIAERDANGDVIFLRFGQHGVLRPKDMAERQGLSDADMTLLRHFPKLQGLSLESQPVGPEGLAVLAELPDLVMFAHKNPKHGAAPGAGEDTGRDPEYLRPLDACRQLRVLDLTHSFSVKTTIIDQLQGFPNLEWLSVDTSASEAPLADFLQHSPKLMALRLHRTGMDDAALERCFAAIPDLRFLELKLARGRKNNDNDATLRLFAEYLPKLEILELTPRPGGFPPPHDWENGLEYLAQAPSLRVLSIGEPKDGSSDPALERLRAARPDILINPDDFVGLAKPLAFDWDLGPSTFRTGAPPPDGPADPALD